MLVNKKYLCKKADIWALGVILFSLVTNVRPYEEPDERVEKLYDLAKQKKHD